MDRSRSHPDRESIESDGNESNKDSSQIAAEYVVNGASSEFMLPPVNNHGKGDILDAQGGGVRFQGNNGNSTVVSARDIKNQLVEGATTNGPHSSQTSYFSSDVNDGGGYIPNRAANTEETISNRQCEKTMQQTPQLLNNIINSRVHDMNEQQQHKPLTVAPNSTSVENLNHQLDSANHHHSSIDQQQQTEILHAGLPSSQQPCEEDGSVHSVPNASLAHSTYVATTTPQISFVHQVGILQAQQRMQQTLQQVNQLQQQLLALNGIVLQPPFQSVFPPPEQQRSLISALRNQIETLANAAFPGTNLMSTMTTPQMQLLNQNQQLLLLTHIMQNMNNSNANGGVDVNALMAAITRPQDTQVLNSFMGVNQALLYRNQQLIELQQSLRIPSHATSSNISTNAESSPHALPQLTTSTGIDLSNTSTENHSVILPPTSLISSVSEGATRAQPISVSIPNTTDDLCVEVNQTSFVAATVPDTSSSRKSDIDVVTTPNLASDSTSDQIALNFNPTAESSPNIMQTKKGGTSSETTPRFPRILYNEADDAILGEYQSLLRKQLEIFEANSDDVINGTFRQGRSTPIQFGQIGLRCRHCASIPISVRSKGSVYFSQTINGMYQIAQNMSKVHLCERCTRIPENIKKRMMNLRSRKGRASGGRSYWIRHLREMGIYEDGNILRARHGGNNEKTSSRNIQSNEDPKDTSYSGTEDMNEATPANRKPPTNP